MRQKAWLVAAFGLLAAGGSLAAQETESLLRKNIGLMLDAPFLHQEELPYESEYSGPYGDELVTYEYDADGLPIFIRYADLDTGIPYMDAEVTYRSDGQIETLTYTSYDDEGDDVLYVDRFDFADYIATGPRLGTMITGEGMTAQMRMSYDEAGRLTGLEEDDAYGEGFFRIERYAWAELADRSVPYAIELRFPLDGEIERYRYLYDARDRLVALEGFNALSGDPGNATTAGEWYSYRTGSLEETFGPIEPAGTPSTTALR